MPPWGADPYDDPIPPERLPGPIGLAQPCRKPDEGLRDVTVPAPSREALAARARARHREACKAVGLAAVVCAPVLVLAEVVLR